MELNEVQFGAQPPIDGYGPGYFRVGDKLVQGHIFVHAGAALSWKGLGSWDSILAAQPEYEILLIGTGAEIARLTPQDQTILDAADIVYEVMASAPAARTYNVLLSEQRRVAVALLTV
ncbi:MAG: Mth938-like domain-containing protein [Pseudomonadota bacterium]